MEKSIYSQEYRNMLKQLKKARLKAGLTQTAVAKKLRKPQSFVSKAEMGERRLDVTELKKFANIYKKDVSELLK